MVERFTNFLGVVHVSEYEGDPCHEHMKYHHETMDIRGHYRTPNMIAYDTAVDRLVRHLKKFRQPLR